MNQDQIQQARKEAEEEAKKILKDKKKFSTKEFDAKCNTVKTFKKAKHVYLKQSKVDYCVNNNLDIMYLYEEMESKYSGDIGNKKKYYTPTGKKRGRQPKQNNNEQEQ
jgi:hypothetical protein